MRVASLKKTSVWLNKLRGKVYKVRIRVLFLRHNITGFDLFRMTSRQVANST
jgi:hypothetical protein